MKRTIWIALATLSAWAALTSASASAQGFGIYEQGTCLMSRGGAGVAEPCADGSSIYINPAGMAGPKGWVVSGGGTLIRSSGSFTSDQGHTDHLDNDVALVPHVYGRYGINQKFAAGVGVYFPYGLTVKWPLDFSGRFVSYNANLKTAYVQPTAAWTINERISVGGGLTWAIGTIALHRREDLARVPLPTVPGLTFGALVDNGTDFADTTLSSSKAYGVGANVGVVLKPLDRLRIGARYLTRVKLTYDGMATFNPVAMSYRVTKPNPLGLPVGTPIDSAVSQVLAALPNQGVSTEITMPAQFVTGVSIHATPRVTLFVDYQWVQWSSFDAIVLNFSQPVPPDETLVQNDGDTSALRSGVAIQVPHGLRVSAGFITNQAAAPDENVTPLLPEARHNHYTAGLGWNVGSKIAVDVAYQFVQVADRRGRVVSPPSGQLPTIALNSGVYRSRADLLGLTVTWHP